MSRKTNPTPVEIRFHQDTVVNMARCRELWGDRPELWVKRNLAAVPYVNVGEERMFFLSDIEKYLRDNRQCPQNANPGSAGLAVVPDPEEEPGSSDGGTERKTA